MQRQAARQTQDMLQSYTGIPRGSPKKKRNLPRDREEEKKIATAGRVCWGETPPVRSRSNQDRCFVHGRRGGVDAPPG